jgi:hypothetical protein
MRTLGRRWSLLISMALLLTLPLATTAQDATADEDAVVLPELEGLAWYRSTDVSGAQMPDRLSEDEVTAWSVLADGAGGSLDDLSYTFDLAFDPAALPRIGAMATVRVDGADPAALQAAVVQDIVDQAVSLGAEPPDPKPTMLGDKAVTVVKLPEVMGFETATVYTIGDVAYVMLLPAALVAEALERLP